MYFRNKFINFYLLFEVMILVKCDNNLNTNQLNADDFEKRRSFKEFFDSLVAGSNQNTKTSSQSYSTPRPAGPIYMPFAVPVHSPPPPSPPPGPHVHIAPPPSFGYSSNINNIYKHPSSPHQSRPHLHMNPMGQNYGGPHHHHHNHNHNHGFGPLSPMNQNFVPQSHHYPIPHLPHSPFNHYDYGQQSRPIAIAIPLPFHAIPLHLFQQNEDNNKPNNFLPNTEFNDGMSPTTKFALFADPFEDVVDEDLFDNSDQQLKYIPVHKNEWKNT